MSAKNFKNTVALATVAALALAVPGVADAAPKKTTHAASAKKKAPAKSASAKEVQDLAAQLKQSQEQMAQMQAQMAQMQAKIDQQQATTAPVIAQTQQQAASADAKADKALASADATATAQAKTDKSVGLMKWAADTKISGRMYFNASAIDHESLGTKVGNTDNGYGFAIKRFYLGVDHKFNDTFAANITTDVSAISGVGMSLYIKKAYLEAKIAPEFVVRAGADDMPWIPYVESIYGYRHIEQTLVDRTKYGTSSDWGVHAFGSFADGLISYNVAAVTGAGYRNVQFSHSVDFEGRLSAKYLGFNLGIGGYTGKLGSDTETPAAGTPPPQLRTYGRFDVLAAYSGKDIGIPVTVGFEYFWAENKVFNKTAALPESSPHDASEGYSVFASVNPIDKWSLFGKWEDVSPSKHVSPDFKENYFNLGVQWEPVKIVDVALVYKRNVAHNGAFSTGDLWSGVVGCATSASLTCTGKGSYDEVGIYGQLRW
jgi:hypothetical protein